MNMLTWIVIQYTDIFLRNTGVIEVCVGEVCSVYPPAILDWKERKEHTWIVSWTTTRIETWNITWTNNQKSSYINP